ARLTPLDGRAAREESQAQPLFHISLRFKARKYSPATDCAAPSVTPATKAMPRLPMGCRRRQPLASARGATTGTGTGSHRSPPLGAAAADACASVPVRGLPRRD